MTHTHAEGYRLLKPVTKPFSVSSPPPRRPARCSARGIISTHQSISRIHAYYLCVSPLEHPPESSKSDIGLEFTTGLESIIFSASVHLVLLGKGPPAPLLAADQQASQQTRVAQ